MHLIVTAEKGILQIHMGFFKLHVNFLYKISTNNDISRLIYLDGSYTKSRWTCRQRKGPTWRCTDAESLFYYVPFSILALQYQHFFFMERSCKKSRQPCVWHAGLFLVNHDHLILITGLKKMTVEKKGQNILLPWFIAKGITDG